MRIVGTTLALVIGLGGGYFILQQYLNNSSAQESPGVQVDVVGIRQQLLTIGQSERQYQAAHGTYATLEQLAQEGLLPGGTQIRGYSLSATVSGSERFSIVATPGEAKAGWPTLELNESMQIATR